MAGVGGGGGSAGGFLTQRPVSYGGTTAQQQASKGIVPQPAGGSLAQQSYQAYLRGEKKGIAPGMSYGDYQGKYFGGGGGGGRPGGGGGNLSGQPMMPYQPLGPKVQNIIDPLAQAGQGLLDPNSPYHQRMQSQLSENIGKTSAAQQRAAALRAAQAGMGGGASPELLETQADIGRSGLEAQGDAYAQALLGGMGLGGQLSGSALSGQLGLQGQQQQGYLAQQQAMENRKQMEFQAQLEQQRLAQQMMLQQMQMMSGMF